MPKPSGTRFDFNVTIVFLVVLAYPLLVLLAHLVFKVPMETLGQVGDSVAPMTAVLAAVAAYASVKAYRAQLRTAESEESRAAAERFDAQFFKLLAHYDDLVSRCTNSRELRVDDHNWLIPSSTAVVNADGTVTLSGVAVLVDQIATTQARWPPKEGQGSPSYCEAFFIGMTQNIPIQLQLAPVADTVVAMVETLSHIRSNVDLEPYARILCARISNWEREFWQISIARMGTDSPVFQFAVELGLFSDEPPLPFGGWPFAVMYKKGRRTSFYVEDMKRWNGNPAWVQP